MIFARALLAVAYSLTFLGQTGWTKSQEKASSKAGRPFPELHIPLITESPHIDGALDEAVWKNPPLPVGEWLSYNPLYGNKIVQSTQVWAAYDKTGSHFAFHCFDPEPEKIKTAFGRRDTIFNDGWIWLSLDSLGSHQSSYEFFVNPSGIQMDILNSSTVGEDTSPDWVRQHIGFKERQ